jgi:hypothetical protein
MHCQKALDTAEPFPGTFPAGAEQQSAENAMRPVALGRRNWIHIGSEQAGPRVAAIISVVETCRRLKIPIREYLCSILPGLANFPINRIAELTPASWLARNLPPTSVERSAAALTVDQCRLRTILVAAPLPFEAFTLM